MNNRQARAEETRRILLEAAREVFAERGYGSTTVAAVTAAAATAHGTFYLYFKNKEDVFVHVISDVLDELYQESFTPIELLPEQHDPRLLRERIAGFLAVMVRHRRLWRALLEGSLASPVVEEHWMGQRRRFQTAMAERWRRRQDLADLGQFDVDVTANALASMLEWYAFTGLAFEEPRPLEVDDQLIDTMTELWIRSLGVAR